MTAYNFTAAAATDQLAIIGHGLTTGDGPVTTLVTGGSSGGLVESVDYWIIRVDADHVKLATSSANALAGTPFVDVTSNISGILGIGLPFRRSRTYVPWTTSPAGAQVKSADLNALQDRTLLSTESLVFYPGRGVGSGHTDNLLNVNLGTGALTIYTKAIDIPAGRRVRSVKIDAIGNGADDVNIAVGKAKRNSSTPLTTDTWSNIPGGVGATRTINLDPSNANTVIAAGESLYLAFDGTTGAGITIYGITVEIDPRA